MCLSWVPGWKSEIGSPGLGSAEASLLGLQTAAFSLCPHLVFPRCSSLGIVFCPNSLFCKDISQIGLGPALVH